MNAFLHIGRVSMRAIVVGVMNTNYFHGLRKFFNVIV